jgi:hypothetical protein
MIVATFTLKDIAIMNIYYTILTFSTVLYAILLHNYQGPSSI